ncbi:MAG: threonine--tRNA ligase [Candidatus Aenigmarchaeota archaeon]|nr:threonine--tRNA ligase [Candidatus Aenigmarchaeota archaeon]
MRLLILHSDFIEWEPKKKAIKNPEEVEKKRIRVEDALVVFSSVEKGDEKNKKEIIDNSVKAVLGVLKQVKAKNIVVYPYVHLSSNPGAPSDALDVVKGVEEKLKEKKLSVYRSPFGWYKSFCVSCKGHPLSELSREIHVQKEGSQEEDIDYKQLLREISKSKLDREELKPNDHRILGQDLDLFSFSEVAPGMVFWHDKGWIIYNELVKFWKEEHRKAGYQEVSTPQILDKKLWQISGHWEKYKENIFLTEYEKRSFAVKPMNCPGGIMIYKNKPKSYNDLPLRVGELGVVHRQELSGVLAGLFRVIKFTQDDAHIYCTEEQLEDEIMKVVRLTDNFYKKFNMPYHIELSTRPEKRIGSDEIWDKAEKTLESVLKKNKIKHKINKGDGAFYGPKIDFHVKDSMGRTWQCGTNQLDFAMPERFDMTYKTKDNKDKRPIMLHRTIYGSLERFIGILLEHTNGNLPLWLSPVHVRVLSFTDRNKKSAEKIHSQLLEAGIRSEVDLSDNTVDYKVRDAELKKVPFIVVIGDKEEKAGTVAVRERGVKKVKFGEKLDKFIENVSKKIEKRE